MPTGTQSHTVTVLGVDTGGNADERPRLVWSAPNVLLVTIPAQSYLKVLTRQVGGVHVSIEFEPSAATRAAWLKSEGLEPDPLEGR